MFQILSNRSWLSFAIKFSSFLHFFREIFTSFHQVSCWMKIFIYPLIYLLRSKMHAKLSTDNKCIKIKQNQFNFTRNISHLTRINYFAGRRINNSRYFSTNINRKKKKINQVQGSADFSDKTVWVNFIWFLRKGIYSSVLLQSR